MVRPYSLRELREGISQLGEWDAEANKLTVMVPDSAKAGPDSGEKDDLATLPLRPMVFVYRDDALVFEGSCLVDLEGLEGRSGPDVESYVAGWIERSAVPPDATVKAKVSLLSTDEGALVATVRIELRR